MPRRPVQCGYLQPLRLALPAAFSLALFACAPPAITGGFDSPHPDARIFAAERAARHRDLSAIPHLIENLEHDDPAVRFVAIKSLEYLTGETFGYRYFDPEIRRRAAVERWVAAYSSSTVPTASAGPIAASPPAKDASK